jgi:uncharacterized protein (DUF927 family)
MQIQPKTKEHFTSMIDTKASGNIADFKNSLKKLNKADLLRFAVYCSVFDLMHITDIEKYYNS